MTSRSSKSYRLIADDLIVFMSFACNEDCVSGFRLFQGELDGVFAVGFNPNIGFHVLVACEDVIQ